MKRHTISLDEISKKLFLQYENTLASSSGMEENKELSIRTTINMLSGATDVLYIVRDRKKPGVHEIQMITSHLGSAIDAYNRI